MLMEYLRTFTKEIEQVSVDECYVDLTQEIEFASPVYAACSDKKQRPGKARFYGQCRNFFE